jgi:phytoene synthase
MSQPAKTSRTEDFPVASRLLRADLRADILLFYRLARAGDDCADDPALSPPERLAALEALRPQFGDLPAAIPMLTALWDGFARDAAGWQPATAADLIAQCHRTAAPVADFLLTLHGEAPATRPPGAALAVALQLLNHGQDRAQDEAAGRPRLPPPLSAADLTDLISAHLEEAAPLPALITDSGLRRQAAMTLAVARHHQRRLKRGRRGPGPAGWLAGFFAALRPLPAMPLPASSFALAIASLKGDQRRALLAVYGWCRMLDDAADETPQAPDLTPFRLALAALRRGDWVNPLSADLYWACCRFSLSPDDLEAVIDGVAMDSPPPVAPPEAIFTLYCDRVAGAVGRLVLTILGTRQDALADCMGRGLQRINVLRDLTEDAARGRLYLPSEFLSRHHLPADPAACLSHAGLAMACADWAELAEQELDRAESLIRHLPAAINRKPLWLMLLAYRLLLKQLRRHPAGTRARLSSGDRVRLLIRALLP